MTNTIIQYTEEQVKNLTNQELVDIVKGLNINNKRVIRRVLRKENKHVLQEILNRTNFLNEHFSNKNTIVPIDAILYCLENNITEHPTCKAPGCSNTVNWSHHTFQTYCCIGCVGKDSDVIRKREETSLQTIGVTNILKSKDVQQQIFEKQTMLYGGVGFASPQINSKIQSTMEERFGVKYAAHSEQIMDNVSNTNNLKYGNKCSLHGEDIKQKTIETNLRNLGVPYPMMAQSVQNKSKLTCTEHWGVDNYVKSREYHKKAHKRYTNPKYPDITFGSSWEFIVYDFLKEHNIEFEYQLEPIPYEYDGKTYYYVPDFLVNGRIYEVKGDNFFRINKSTGKEEMYKPWRRPEWSDEYYKWLCDKEEAKHQYMLKNDVIILRGNDIKNIDDIEW